MRGRLSKITGALAAAIGLTLAAPASAEPTVWAKAREPRLIKQDEVIRTAIKVHERFHMMTRVGGRMSGPAASLVLRGALKDVAGVVAAGSADFSARLFYAELLRDTGDNEEATKVLTALLKDSPPAPIRSDAFGELAIMHALAGRREEEIHAYTQALALEPHAYARATLLANRAEAMMAMGDLEGAVEGYRQALEPLTTIEMFFAGSTTLFSLGVALDRLGNPEAGLQSVRLARSYDPQDKRLKSDTWFFSPARDEHWYWALGGWSCGRSSAIWPVRAECYERSVAEWELYIERAPEDDRYVSIARARLATVKRERDDMRRAYDAEKKRIEDEERATERRRPREVPAP